MFIDRAKTVRTNSVRRSGIQLEVHPSRNHSAPPNGAGGLFSSIYKHVTPNGVNTFSIQRTR
jgi:hypothetical protein